MVRVTCLAQSGIVHEKPCMGAATWILADVIYQVFPVQATSSRGGILKHLDVVQSHARDFTTPPRPLSWGPQLMMRPRQPQPQPLFASAGHEPARVFNDLSFSSSSLSSASPLPIIYSLKIFFSLKSQHVHYLSILVKMLKFLTLTFLAACAIPLALADGGPTRTFVARAYQSPYPIGQQFSGAYLFVSEGSFFLSKAEPSTKAKLSTDSGEKAYLV